MKAKLHIGLLPFMLFSYLSCTGKTQVVDEPPLSSLPPEPVQEKTEETTPQEQEEFVITEKIYSQTLDEIKEFVQVLNQIIENKDFKAWSTYLTTDYIQRTSDPQYLAEQSEKPILKKKNIMLKSLNDYFTYVVVPSRSGAHIDDIEFIDRYHVKAISIIRNTRGLLYLLVLEEDQWKIGVW
jgi:hypothetical protein